MCARSVIRLLVASLLIGVASGCFVNDEMNKASALIKGPGAAAPGAAAPGSANAAAAKPGAGATAAAKPAAPAGKSWWETARSLTSEESDESITRCELAGRAEFMLRDDCLSRGGVPK